jgi:NifU-like protein involved in Fe-S cluster formation
VTTATALYTPEVLKLATGLAAYPLGDDLPLRGHARSATCGSTIEVGLALNADARIERAGLRAHACAIGQAAAAIFLAAAPGRSRGEIALSIAELESWLGGQDEIPNWPGLQAIAAARELPARHGAMLLPWRAALDALPSA